MVPGASGGSRRCRLLSRAGGDPEGLVPKRELSGTGGFSLCWQAVTCHSSTRPRHIGPRMCCNLLFIYRYMQPEGPWQRRLFLHGHTLHVPNYIVILEHPDPLLPKSAKQRSGEK